MSIVRDPSALSYPGSALSKPRPEGDEPVRLLRTPFVAARASTDELVGLELDAGTRDVARRLFARGCSGEFVRAIVGEVRSSGARGAHAIDRAAEALARAVPPLASPRRALDAVRVPLIALVGPTGVGKTTVLVELGRRLRAAGRRIGFAGLDLATLQALEQMGGVQMGGADGSACSSQPGALDAVLFDTPGLSPREPERLAHVAHALARRAEPFELRALLVLSCAASRSALALTIRAFAPFRAVGAILSKLDETDEPAGAFEALARARLPLAFLCEGREGCASLTRATRETLPDLLLGGSARGNRTDRKIPT